MDAISPSTSLALVKKAAVAVVVVAAAVVVPDANSAAVAAAGATAKSQTEFGSTPGGPADAGPLFCLASARDDRNRPAGSANQDAADSRTRNTAVTAGICVRSQSAISVSSSKIFSQIA